MAVLGKLRMLQAVCQRAGGVWLVKLVIGYRDGREAVVFYLSLLILCPVINCYYHPFYSIRDTSAIGCITSGRIQATR